MFSKTIKLTDSKQESSECKAKEPLNSGDKQECGQIKVYAMRIIYKEMHLSTKRFWKCTAEKHTVKQKNLCYSVICRTNNSVPLLQ